MMYVYIYESESYNKSDRKIREEEKEKSEILRQLDGFCWRL